ncbi:MAG: HAD family hydrolase [Firmicutes bacterium]|nr:HAD family hydrolase [Bacillota bacterium]
MNKKLVLWDIDGTLMSCYRDGTLAMNETFRRRTGHENACGEVIVGTSMDSSLVDSIMDRFGIDPGEKDNIIAEFAAILKEIVTANKTKKILPGVKEILDVLAQREDVFMGLITSNFRIGAEIKLDSVGLKEYFEFGGFGDHPGEKWDAAREAVEEASRLAGGDFKPENIFVIGDSRYDIECAKKIGAKSIGVATGWMKYEELEKTEPDYIFKNLENTEEFLELICGYCL